MKIYFAAPWFSTEQASIHKRVEQALDMTSHHIFSPKRELVVKPDDPKSIRAKAFTGNLKAIDDADLVVAVTDYKDIGTIWEAGYAYRGLKPILYYAETLGDRPFNLMLAQSGMGVVRDEVTLRLALQYPSVGQVSEYCMKNGLNYGGLVE